MSKWRKVKLGDVAIYISRGVTPAYSEDGVIIINQKCIRNNTITYIQARKTNPDIKNIMQDKYLQTGDVLVNSTGVGTLGRVAQFRDNKKATVDSHITIIRPDINKIDSIYFAYIMYNLESVLTEMGEGATGQTELSRVRVKELDIFYIDDFKEQRKIAGVLSTYDDLIEVNNRRIAILESQAQKIYNEWFVKFKFPGHKKTKIKNNLPEGWEEKNILDIKYFEFCKSKVREFEGEKEYFATANINDINIVKDGEMVTFSNKPSRAQIKPVYNSVWFARMKDSFKVLVYRNINKEMIDRHILSSGMIGFEAKEEYFAFLYFTINSEWFHKLKDQNATGATQISLTNDGLSKIKIIVPQENLVKKYSQIINEYIDEIIQLQKINSTLRKTRDKLLPKLISGEIEVK